MPAPNRHADSDPDFVYVILIATSPQNVWNALTDGETARAWWANTRHESSFEVGGALTFRRDGKVDVRGEILERKEPTNLTYSFHVEGPGPQHDEGVTHVTYTLEQVGESTRLTVVHTGFKAGSRVRVGVSNGWPGILSRLKSVLEGARMPDYA